MLTAPYKTPIDGTMEHPFRHFFSRSPRTLHGSMPNSRRLAFNRWPTKEKPAAARYARRGSGLFAVAVKITLPDSPCSAPKAGKPRGARHEAEPQGQVRA